jgi:hypothetical protein
MPGRLHTRGRASVFHPVQDVQLAIGTTKIRRDWVALSHIGKQVVAKRSGHHIPLDEPDLVVAAIRDVIPAARQ